MWHNIVFDTPGEACANWVNEFIERSLINFEFERKKQTGFEAHSMNEHVRWESFCLLYTEVARMTLYIRMRGILYPEHQEGRGDNTPRSRGSHGGLIHKQFKCFLNLIMSLKRIRIHDQMRFSINVQHIKYNSMFI